MKKVIGEYSGNPIGYSIRNQGKYLLFRAESETEIQIEDAKSIQEREEGRLIVGYSFDNFHLEKEGGMFVATWNCLSSCD